MSFTSSSTVKEILTHGHVQCWGRDLSPVLFLLSAPHLLTCLLYTAFSRPWFPKRLDCYWGSVGNCPPHLATSPGINHRLPPGLWISGWYSQGICKSHVAVQNVYIIANIAKNYLMLFLHSTPMQVGTQKKTSRDWMWYQTLWVMLSRLTHSNQTQVIWEAAKINSSIL